MPALAEDRSYLSPQAARLSASGESGSWTSLNSLCGFVSLPRLLRCHSMIVTWAKLSFELIKMPLFGSWACLKSEVQLSCRAGCAGTAGLSSASYLVLSAFMRGGCGPRTTIVAATRRKVYSLSTGPTIACSARTNDLLDSLSCNTWFQRVPDAYHLINDRCPSWAASWHQHHAAHRAPLAPGRRPELGALYNLKLDKGSS